MTTPTPKELKQAHGQRVINAMDAVVTEIQSESELWFGGLPPAFTEAVNMLTHVKTRIRDTLEIPPAA